MKYLYTFHKISFNNKNYIVVIKQLILYVFILVIAIFSSPAFSFSWQQTELHHIFPKKYEKWFSQRGIDIDEYCIQLSRKHHTGRGDSSIHYRKYILTGKNFNQSWKFFIKNNYSATQRECFSFIICLLGEFGISIKQQTFYHYKTRKISLAKISEQTLFDYLHTYLLLCFFRCREAFHNFQYLLYRYQRKYSLYP